ncbi:hypothetical protein Taro_040133, partial [Colocasia esculenta]|nr:hypothetical protein [Colocasia esculenta]
LQPFSPTLASLSHRVVVVHGHCDDGSHSNLDVIMLELVGPDGKVAEEERGASCVVDRIACSRDNHTRMEIKVRAPAYVAGSTRMAGEMQLVPPWLEPLLEMLFFSTCATHGDALRG